MGNRTCSVLGCNSSHNARGLCMSHYMQAMRSDTLPPPVPKPSPEERFWQFVAKAEGCWIWTGSLTGGYGRFKMGGRVVQAHRFSWELANDPIPDGMMLDHRCHNRACVNPDHLRLVTNAQNMQHRVGANADNASSGHRGVEWHKASRKWKVHARAYDQRYYGGLFSDIDDAVAAAHALRDRVMTHHIA